MNTRLSSFLNALHADGPAVDRATKMGLYGWLVGEWETDIIAHEENGTQHRGNGEIHAGWVLEGRAVQDIWMIPRRAECRPDAPSLPVAGNWYGATLRVYDPGLDVWHIFWNDPATRFFTRQIGRARGNDIVQEGKLDSGALQRWNFTEITPRSFHWFAEYSPDGGASWRLQVDVFARRVSSA